MMDKYGHKLFKVSRTPDALYSFDEGTIVDENGDITAYNIRSIATGKSVGIWDIKDIDKSFKLRTWVLVEGDISHNKVFLEEDV